jgi:hypothetical protein
MPSVHDEVETARRNGYLSGLRVAILHLSADTSGLKQQLEKEYGRVVRGGALPRP